MHLYTMSRMERNRCVEVILEYYKTSCSRFPGNEEFFCSSGAVCLVVYGSTCLSKDVMTSSVLGEADNALYCIIYRLSLGSVLPEAILRISSRVWRVRL